MIILFEKFVMNKRNLAQSHIQKEVNNMIKLANKLLITLLISVFMISVVSATAYPVEVATEKNILEFKEKKVTSFKINWDANGGKIGTKKTVTTTVNKGAKVKLVTNPKRAGYTFQGWYSATR